MTTKTTPGDTPATPQPARRRFLGAAASGAVGAAAMTAPMISVAQSPIMMKMQS
mgnify:CR=1 FL=1